MDLSQHCQQRNISETLRLFLRVGETWIVIPFPEHQGPTTNVSSTCAILGNPRMVPLGAAKEIPTVLYCRSRRGATEVTEDVLNILIEDPSGDK